MSIYKSLALGFTALVAFGGPAAAADFPVRPIQVIVPYSAGGGTDLSARIMADVFKKHVDGGTIVVRDQPGGGGAIGTSAALHARPDGYTLGTGSQGPLALLPHFGGTDYSLDDVQFIGMMGWNLKLLVGCKDAPFSNFEEMMDYARDNPGQLQIGNSGAGGADHIAIEAFAKAADVDLEPVPFNGASEGMTACLGGHIDAMTSTPSEALPHAQSGAVTPLFIMSDKRIPDYPDTPTAIEGGVDFTWASWKGIIAPKGLPEDVLATLKDAFKATFTDPDFVSKMEEMGEFVEYRDGDAYRALAERDSNLAKEVIQDLGMYGMNK
ncbi:tripartite tricarboxylate transporter substrate binding protein [Roseospira marina]|uniref:Tripartite tricarboxylate transporter substrate binding protein n=1 Tax=Roseospira marina TaxID=140057 RepID=A0A5M6I7S4_9PROT|nr:tripartite tricarboxylate transporter substrate binding protein [Roseospira marina]KAA5604192.1 tripartite tricarboxylate transporter substrate binding protein [Roseospira marina]MBB4315712.1 tripartite-type tricarboxylate transporter receptor subunit TctC [Roseospira marina]MBB5088824.1 tripartite-type tricarboxylate transporter receptor subunit TctC [Roseospira marina]